jgi:PilZ domain
MKNLSTPHADTAPELPPSFDRRNRERIALHIPLRVLSYGLLAEKCDDAICTDLSESGMAFDSTAQLTVGEIVILEFQLKGEAPYRCHARLTYRMGRRYGGYFLGAE